MFQYFSLSSIKRNTYQSLSVIIGLFFIHGCASVKKLAVEKDISQLLNQSDVFSNQFTGFSLFDIESGEYVASHNSTLKFTPASNTKLLTMYVTLKTFSDSIPSLIYRNEDSILYVSPIGDPSFLYAPFTNQKTFRLLSEAVNVKIEWPKEEIELFGSGWAWDDYKYSYQPQRSWWPIYGNTVSINKINDSISISPCFFEDYVEILEQTKPGDLIDRELKFNVFKAYLDSDTSNFERIIPFEYSNELFVQLLADTLSAKLEFSNESRLLTDTLFSQHIDTVLAAMLKPSDNFLAEQLLLMAAKWNGYNEVKPFINQVKSTWLASLNDLVWADGSGLSRYNLIAPVDQVRLLKMCYDEYGWERMKNLLPTGGEGTLEELYLPNEDEDSYIFAKTGTLSNNHNLSGFLITKSGKKLIFSLMNNHYTRPTKEIKLAMQQFLLDIREAY